MASMSDEKRLRELLTVFLEENTKLNLSALRTEDACWTGNILDSLALLEIPQFSTLHSSLSTLDIGTGGGFPLLPLAISRPQWHCTGLDSIGKKIAAVDRIVKTMNLKNVTVIADRSEPLGHKPKHREKYDLVVSRAVAPLNILLELCAPFVKVGGHIVLWKSLQIEEELKASTNAQKILHCPLTTAHRYTLPGDFGERQLLMFTKESSLPAAYPRAVGEAKTNPLS